jgi:hypothetical protein
MAITVSQPTGNSDGFTPKGVKNSLFNLADPTKYTSLYDFINEVNAPDVRAQLVKQYGDQGITGFLKLTGAVNAAGTADQVQYFEEARLHQGQAVATGFASATSGDITVTAAGSDNATAMVARVGDILLNPADGERLYVTAASGTTVTAATLSGNSTAVADGAVLPIVGNMFAQGSDQPGNFLQSNVVRRINDYAIVKEVYEVSGSQATNIGYIDLGGGDYRWYIKSEADTRQRFLDKREMTMLLGEKTSAITGVAGTEGYFAAIEDRGIVTSDIIDALDDLDVIVKQLDKNGAPAEYAVYANSNQFLKLDDAIAGIESGNGGLMAAYGAFNNDKDMALNLGFKSFSRGGYTFHKHAWKLLNDPTLLGQTSIGQQVASGVMIPIANVVDPKSGNRAPALEMNYKATNGYSREMEHWVTGGGVLGFTNDTQDLAKFNYRSECCLVTRAANQHVLIKATA